MRGQDSHITNDVYIGTILLESSRWARPRTPTYRVSEWLARFEEAGFDGMELWEYHATLAGADELAAMETSPVPVAVYSTYCDFDDASEADRLGAAQTARRLAAGGVKFNVGRDPALRDHYVRNLRRWADLFDDDVRLLCECHGGTIVENSDEAARLFDEVGRGRFEMIVHCFGRDVELLRAWFGHFGEAVTHSHVALRDEQGSARLRSDPAHVREVLAVMRGEGYAGSFTLEFTEGTSAPDENIDALWRAALDDLRFLRECLASA
jgi:sugar phosphate isomerase/epimerase